MVQADTLDDLAAALDMPVSSLKATVEAWNAACAAGEDAAYGRVKQLTALDEAPYFAWKTQNTNIGSIGGLLIDTDAAVLDTNGDPIPHLFGAGVDTAGWNRTLTIPALAPACRAPSTGVASPARARPLRHRAKRGFPQ